MYSVNVFESYNRYRISNVSILTTLNATGKTNPLLGDALRMIENFHKPTTKMEQNPWVLEERKANRTIKKKGKTFSSNQ